MKPGDQTHDTEEKDREAKSVRSPGEMEKKKSGQTDKAERHTQAGVRHRGETCTDGETQRNRIRKRVPEFRPGGGVEG